MIQRRNPDLPGPDADGVPAPRFSSPRRVKPNRRREIAPTELESLVQVPLPRPTVRAGLTVVAPEGVPMPVPMLRPKPKRDKPVAIVRADRPGLTCLTCDEPAPYRIMSLGILGASTCNRHKHLHCRAARRVLGLPNPSPRRRAPKAAPAMVATDCDECHDDIPYGVTCYAVPTGREDEGRPVVRIVCGSCYQTETA